MNTYLRTLLLIIATFALSACFREPIESYNNLAIPKNVTKTTPSNQRIESAIIRAGNSVGWQMKPVKDGVIDATMTIGKKIATAQVSYTQSSYSITYQSSSGLRYKNDEINDEYNQWVKNLDNAIYNSLQSL